MAVHFVYDYKKFNLVLMTMFFFYTDWKRQVARCKMNLMTVLQRITAK